MNNKLLKILGAGALIAALGATILGSAVFAAGPESGIWSLRTARRPAFVMRGFIIGRTR